MAFADRVNAHIKDLSPYQPGKPIEELERELGLSDSVKLASNENPLGPSPKALAAVRAALEGVSRYPDGASFELRAKLASRLDIPEEQLVFGCGGDEILELIAKVMLSPGDEAVYAWPSFAMYPLVVQGMGAVSVQVPLDAGFGHDLEAMAAAVNERTKLVIVCNPNNPTGTSFGAAALDHFVEALSPDVALCIDEAYFEYVRRPDFPDALAWVRKRPGTLVLRTFSKIYGLAGLRVGYGIADPELADFLHRARHPFNVNRLAEAAALAALDDDEHVEHTRRINAEGAEMLERELAALGIRTWPTDANYILAEAGAGAFDALLPEGVIVRSLQGFGMPNHIRISIGLPEENERLVKAMRKLKEAGS